MGGEGAGGKKIAEGRKIDGEGDGKKNEVEEAWRKRGGLVEGRGGGEAPARGKCRNEERRVGVWMKKRRWRRRRRRMCIGEEAEKTEGWRRRISTLRVIEGG